MPEGGESAASPRRIALVIGQLSLGGAEGQLYELATRLDRRRFAPVVYSLTAAGEHVREKLRAAGVPVHVVGGGGMNRVRRLAAALAAEPIDLVHSWLFIANTYSFAARLGGPRPPLVTSARNCKSQGALHHLANVAAFRASAAVIVNSELVAEDIQRRYRTPRHLIHVVPNGVDMQRFRPAGERWKGGPVVLAVGRFVEQKNPMLFAEAALRLASRYPEVRFRMVGDGPLRTRVRERVRNGGLADRFDLPGERGDIENEIRAADVFWLPSSWEGMPNVILEAMACGVPVVATDVGGTRELFDSGCEGFLVRPHEVADFVHYGGALLADRELRRRMGEAARRRAAQFSLTRMVTATESVYERALVEA